MGSFKTYSTNELINIERIDVSPVIEKAMNVSLFSIERDGDYLMFYENGQKRYSLLYSDIRKDDDSTPSDIDDAISYLNTVIADATGTVATPPSADFPIASASGTLTGTYTILLAVSSPTTLDNGDGNTTAISGSDLTAYDIVYSGAVAPELVLEDPDNLIELSTSELTDDFTFKTSDINAFINLAIFNNLGDDKAIINDDDDGFDMSYNID